MFPTPSENILRRCGAAASGDSDFDLGPQLLPLGPCGGQDREHHLLHHAAAIEVHRSEFSRKPRPRPGGTPQRSTALPQASRFVKTHHAIVSQCGQPHLELLWATLASSSKEI